MAGVANSDSKGGGRWPSRDLLLRIVVGVALLLALIFFGQKFLSIQSSLAALTAFEPLWLVPIFACGIAYFVLKALRWHYYLGYAGVQVPVQRSLAAYLAGQWFTFTPAGEFMRAYLLVGQERFAAVAPTIVVQAWIDIVSLALMATLVVPIYPELAPTVLPITLPLLIGITLAITPPARSLVASLPPVRWLQRRFGSNKWGTAVGQTISLFTFRPVAVGIAMSFPILVFGILALLMAARSIDLQQVGFFEAHAVYSMLLLLGGISPLPQGLGVAESSGTFYFAFLGVDPSRALVAVLVFRAAILGLSAVIGLIAFLLLRWAVPDLKTVSVRGRSAAGILVRQKERNPSPASAAGHVAA